MKQQRQKNQPKAAPKVVAAVTPQPAPWVAQMVQHFQATGHYRAEDLERLLGDPRESVEATAEPSMQFCAYLSK
jgi:hypothetical protein